jgi:competence protein ComEA
VPAEVVVHVAGAVARPGVYRLPTGSRVADAVAAAGGALGSAASDAINLARVLTDGEQVYLPFMGEVPPGAVAAAAGTIGHPGGPAGPVDLNRASAADLEALPGIGPATAKKIIDDREKNGPFATVEDLMRVPGIGQKKLEALKEYVTVR